MVAKPEPHQAMKGAENEPELEQAAGPQGQAETR